MKHMFYLAFSLIFCLIFFVLPGSSWGNQVINIQAGWHYTPPANKDLAGFRLYKDDQRVCVVPNPSARNLDCQVEMEPRKLRFTITAYFSDGTESSHSPHFVLDLSENVNMMPILQLLLLDG